MRTDRWSDDRLDDLARRIDSGLRESRAELIAQNRLILGLYASIVVAMVFTHL
jgi:hypothetical protein